MIINLPPDVPEEAIALVVDILNHGYGKHGSDSWRKFGLVHFLQKADGHLDQRSDGSMVDAETKKSHLAHGAADMILALCLELEEDKENK